MIYAEQPATPVFTSSLDDFTFRITGDKAAVKITCYERDVIDEVYFPVNGDITITDLGMLLADVVRHPLAAVMTINITEYENDDVISTWNSGNVNVYYAMVDVQTTAANFTDNHFLTIMLGEKVTALGRKEYLHAIGNESSAGEVACVFFKSGEVSELQIKTDILPVRSTNGVSTFDVSPDLFTAAEYGTLLGYSVKVGKRVQDFVLDLNNPSSAPVLLFTNSFGCQEFIYCTGRHEACPEYSRSSAVINGKKRNYHIEETRVFKADTGVLTTAMANWADDLFRSDEVYLFVDGMPGKEIVITESESERISDEDELPRFTFSYQYSQRIHNVLQLEHAGRIFDNTFDLTFN